MRSTVVDDQDPVPVGIVGLGNFARSQHIPNIEEMPEASLVAICDLDPDCLEAVAEQIARRRACAAAGALAGVGAPASIAADRPRTYRRFDDLLNDPDVKVVVITVRDDLQSEFALRAREAEKHVYVEKPLSTDPEVCLQVAREVEAGGTSLAVGFNKRMAPMYRQIATILNKHGGPGSMHFAMTDDAWRWAKNYPPGYLLGLDVCHHFDMIRLLTGSEIDTVYCRSPRPDDDLLLVTTEAGTAASSMFSGNDSMDAPKELVRIIGDRFSLTGEDYVELFVHGLKEHPASYTFPLRPPVTDKDSEGLVAWRQVRRSAWESFTQNPERPPVIPNFLRDQGWYKAVADFLRCVRNGEESIHARAIDALRAAEATEAALRSRETGQIVRVTKRKVADTGSGRKAPGGHHE